jgi:hypothetical protein
MNNICDVQFFVNVQNIGMTKFLSYYSVMDEIIQIPMYFKITLKLVLWVKYDCHHFVPLNN